MTKRSMIYLPSTLNISYLLEVLRLFLNMMYMCIGPTSVLVGLVPSANFSRSSRARQWRLSDRVICPPRRHLEAKLDIGVHGSRTWGTFLFDWVHEAGVDQRDLLMSGIRLLSDISKAISWVPRERGKDWRGSMAICNCWLSNSRAECL